MHFANCLLSRNSTALNQAMAKSYVCFDQWRVQLGIFFSIRLQRKIESCAEKLKSRHFMTHHFLSSKAETTEMRIYHFIT